MNKNDLRVQKTYNSLMNAFRTLATKKDWEKITVQDICKESMIRRGTFYLHFEDKYEFFKFIAKRTVDSVINEQEIMDPSLNYLDKIRQQIHHIFEYINQNTSRIHITSSEKIINIFVEEFSSTIVELINKFITDQNKKEQINIKLLSAFVTGGLIYSINWTVENKSDQDQAINNIADLEYLIVNRYLI